ncbi:MAG: hypothetical protein DCC75_02935 [Proteobacteria bacterium]|nr:MAG: hypothetical protein DCC75_02935 [Pseudomonadota bacterium]
MKRAIFVVLFTLGLVAPAWAGDKATIVFESGQVVTIDDGYRQIIDAMKKLDGQNVEHRIVEFQIGGGSFLLNVAEVVIVCRDNCSSLTVVHQLDPKRGAAR